MMRRIPQYYFPFENEQMQNINEIAEKSKTDEIDMEIQSREVEISTDRDKLLQKLMLDMNSIELDFKDLPNTVFADGDNNSPVMIVGEGPGEHEVVQKRPFVGRSGQLLNEMLLAAGILRERVYTTNTVIWRPPGNRTPMPDEIEIMRPYLLRHIKIIKPKLLLLVGGIAYRCAMNEIIAISKIRGQWQTRDFCPKIMCIFHPSYLLRAPIHRKETWLDLLNFRQGICELGFENILTKGLLNL